VENFGRDAQGNVCARGARQVRNDPTPEEERVDALNEQEAIGETDVMENHTETASTYNQYCIIMQQANSHGRYR
jgi:hypothetical protein